MENWINAMYAQYPGRVGTGIIVALTFVGLFFAWLSNRSDSRRIERRRLPDQYSGSGSPDDYHDPLL